MRIIHQLPGRLRIQLTKKEVQPWGKGALEACARRAAYIYSASYSEHTHSLLVYYEHQTNAEEIITSLSEKIGPHQRFSGSKVLSLTGIMGLSLLTEEYLKVYGARFCTRSLVALNLLGNISLNPHVFKKGLTQLVRLHPTAESLTAVSVLAAHLTLQPLTATIV